MSTYTVYYVLFMLILFKNFGLKNITLHKNYHNKIDLGITHSLIKKNLIIWN